MVTGNRVILMLTLNLQGFPEASLEAQSSTYHVQLPGPTTSKNISLFGVGDKSN